MKGKDRFLNGVSMPAAAKVWHVNHRLAGKEIASRTLRRRRDGTLTFMDGTPVRAHELIPGQRYDIIEEPQSGEKQ